MTEWIKCSERFPPANTECLAYAIGYMEDDYQIISAWYGDLYYIQDSTPDLKFHEFCNCSGYEVDKIMIENVSHWMPLPEPPKD